MRYAALVISMFLLIQPVDAAVTPEIDPHVSLSVVQQFDTNLSSLLSELIHEYTKCSDIESKGFELRILPLLL